MSPTPPHLRGLGMLRDRVGPRAFSASPRQDVFAGVLLRDITETELGDRPPWLEGHVGTFLGRPLHGRLALAGVPLSGGRCAGVNSPEGPSGSCAPKAPPTWHTRLRPPHPGGARAPRRGGAPARHVDQNRYKREAGLSRTEQRDAAVVPKRTPASAETGSRENAHCGRLVVRGSLTSRHPRVGDCFLAYNSLWCTVCWFIAERG
jgi:hypothetical protein